MRVKQIWTVVPIPQKLRLFWERISVSRLTTFYFFFSVMHCIIQVIFQSQAFAVNAQASTFLWNIVLQGDATLPGFLVYDKDLRECTTVPRSFSTESCRVVWNGTALDDNHGAKAKASASPSAAIAIGSSTAVSSSTSASASASTSASASSQATHTASATVSPGDNAIVSLAFTRVPATPSPSASHSPSATAQNAAVAAATITASSSSLSQTLVDSSFCLLPFVNAGCSTDSDGDDDATLRRARRRSGDGLGKILPVTVDNTTVVTITGLGYTDNEVTLDRECLWALNWPVNVLENTKREDITFIAFQFWVLGMSVVALLNESIPHIIASLLTHLLATAWGGLQIINTARFRDDFMKLTTQGACKPIKLLPTYWQARGDAEIPSLVLNIVSLCFSIFLSYRLIKLFGWQTFKRVGASITINRIYKFVLSLSILIQLSVFFVVASVCLWIDQLCNGKIANTASHAVPYRALSIFVACMMVPWLMMGWFAVRREMRWLMMAFLGLCILYIAGWGAMFDAPTFRWTVKEWLFFTMIIAAGAALVLFSFIVGVVCRINFGKGLPRYLNAQEELPGDDFTPVTSRVGDVESMYSEKVEFPSTSRPVPTFSAAFGKGADVPPPSQMNFGPARGPRFYNQSAEPFESNSDLNSTYTGAGAQLMRHESNRSVSSVGSSNSQSSTSSGRTASGKRIVIE